MKKDPGVFLGHILDSIELIESYSRGKTELDLMESVGLQDQIIRRIEIIGEAVKNLPEDLRRDHPEGMSPRRMWRRRSRAPSAQQKWWRTTLFWPYANTTSSPGLRQG